MDAQNEPALAELEAIRHKFAMGKAWIVNEILKLDLESDMAKEFRTSLLEEVCALSEDVLSRCDDLKSELEAR